MNDDQFLAWPFFEDRHRQLRLGAVAFAGAQEGRIDHHDIDNACRSLVAGLAEAGLLKHAVTSPYGGATDRLDVRSLCLIRETLAYADGLADFAFAMQGLGTGPITLFGSKLQKQQYLPDIAGGKVISAFALSEPEAGSDVAAIACTASPDGPGHVRISGEKTWISNGGIAHRYVVFCRSSAIAGDGKAGVRGLSAYIVDADTPGFSIAERIDTIAPHPLARLRFDGCRVPIANRIGEDGDGFKIAMGTLDVFRSTVGAAALGLARRALHETLGYVTRRRAQNGMLSDLQMVQGTLAEMVADVDTAALLVYRAGWLKDSGAARITREASLAKWVATENAQRVVDNAVQLHGGNGVRVGSKVEVLYRDVRALRIYEGASDVQKTIIARQAIAHFAAPGPAVSAP
jgi:acyl-CoA dehydrogenase